AQALMMDFVKRKALKKGLQVVISSHSPAMISSLPREAIKLLGFDRKTGNGRLVADGCAPEEAFVHLGHTTQPQSRARIIVEDDLAVEIVKTALRVNRPALVEAIDIVAIPGGATGIAKEIVPAFALTGAGNVGVILD